MSKNMSPTANSETVSAGERLRSIVNRIEHLESERKGLSDDIRDIYQEAASAGYDKKVLRQLIRTRKLAAIEIETQEMLLDTYRHAIGG